MNGKNEKERGLLKRILSNKDIQKGIAFFSIALILAFSAVIPVTEEEFNENTIEDDAMEQINFPGYRVHDAILNITQGTTNLAIQDFQGNVLLNETVSEGDSIDLTDIDSPRDPNLLVFTNVQGNLTYTYDLQYSRRPYGLLSLPAAFFTLIGMVFAFKGKGLILGEIKQRKMEEEARKKQEERDDVEEKDKSTGEDEISGEVIFEGESTRTKKGEADHINFMGLPDEDDEDSER